MHGQWMRETCIMETPARHAELKLVQLLQCKDSNWNPNTEEIWQGENKFHNTKHPDSDVSAASICSVVEGSGLGQREFDLCRKKSQKSWMEEYGREEILRLSQRSDRRRKLTKESYKHPFQLQQESEAAQINVNHQDCIPTRATSFQKLDNQIHWESKRNAPLFKLHGQTVLPVDSKCFEELSWPTATKSPGSKEPVPFHSTPDYGSNSIREDSPSSNQIGDRKLLEICKVKKASPCKPSQELKTSRFLGIESDPLSMFSGKRNNGHGSTYSHHLSWSSGGKDRHSKISTSKGLRDRRVRLSPACAIQLFDIQERLGVDQPSKAVDWLLQKSKAAIHELSRSEISSTITYTTPPAPPLSTTASLPLPSSFQLTRPPPQLHPISPNSCMTYCPMVRSNTPLPASSETVSSDIYDGLSLKLSCVTESTTKGSRTDRHINGDMEISEARKRPPTSDQAMKECQVSTICVAPSRLQSRIRARERARERTKEKSESNHVLNNMLESANRNTHNTPSEFPYFM